MAIKLVPRGTIRPENDPLHRISMLSLRPADTTELQRRKDILERGPGQDYSDAEAMREGSNMADPNSLSAQGRETQDVEANFPRGFKQDISFSPGEMARVQGIGRPAVLQAAFKPSLSDKAARDELKMTPQELQMYGRHLGNLRGPGGVDHPDGSRSTLMNMGVELGGKYYNLPRVYDGKILSPDDAIAKAQGLGLENFPSYKNREEAESRYNELHKFMEKDAAQFYRRGPGEPMQERNAFPISGKDPSIVTSHYGSQRSNGHHAGSDMRTPVGTPLTAIDSGTVLKTFSEGGGDRGYGHTMDVIYKDGTVHRMAHLGTADRSVNPYGTFKPGDSFKAGDTLAYSGRSGIHQSAPHVHYEIFANKNMYDKALAAGNSHANVGLRVDPVKYFEGGRDQAVKESLKVQSQGGHQGDTLVGSRREIATTVTDELRKAGYTDNSIAGILRNIKSESDFDPRNRHFDQPGYRGTEAENSHGLFQEGGDNYNRWMNWMKEKYPNGHWTDPKIQAEWVAHRMKTGYPQLDATLRNPNTTKEQAADAFLRQYLNPAAQHREKRSAEYAKGIPSLDSYIGGTPQVTAKPSAAPAVAPTPTGPVEGPVEDPSIAVRQRELSQRPAPGPEDPSIQARQREAQQTAPAVSAPAGTALAPTMGEEDPSANPLDPSVAAAGEAAGAGSLQGISAAPAAPPPPGGVEDPSIAARQREMSTRQAPGPEDPSIVARQEEMRRAQGSAPIAGSEPPGGDFKIGIQPGGIGSDAVASAGSASSGVGNGSSALDSWKPGQPIMPALLGDIFGVGGGEGIFGGGGKAPAFKNLVQSYTPSPDTILPSAGPEQTVLPTSIPPPPPAPPPSPQSGRPDTFLARYAQQHRRRA